MKLATYYQLTKPGIIRGNLLTAAAGFFVASQHHPRYPLLFWTLLGISGIIASACVINNYIDRDIDKMMTRTKKRALVIGLVPARDALIFAGLIGTLGFTILILTTNLLTTLIGVGGMIAYVALYGYYKRRSVHGTLVGTISGAVPPVAGYTAVTNQIDGVAILLFTILVFWQMAHFYAIALYRMKDYAAANIPVMPVVHGVKSTQRQISLYIVGFTGASCLLARYEAGAVYMFIMLITGAAWLVIGLKTLLSKKAEAWARSMFLYSLLVISIWSVAVSIDAFLHIQ